MNCIWFITLNVDSENVFVHWVSISSMDTGHKLNLDQYVLCTFSSRPVSRVLKNIELESMRVDQIGQSIQEWTK